jgi:hypothetical protein
MAAPTCYRCDAIFLAKFVSVALSLSGFTVGFAMTNGCAIVLQVKEKPNRQPAKREPVTSLIG